MTYATNTSTYTTTCDVLRMIANWSLLPQSSAPQINKGVIHKCLAVSKPFTTQIDTNISASTIYFLNLSFTGSLHKFAKLFRL